MELVDDAVIEAIDAVIERFETLLDAGDLEGCNAALHNADFTADSAVLLSMLSMTYCERKRLAEYAPFLGRVRRKLAAELGAAEVDECLRGLE